MVKVIDKF